MTSGHRAEPFTVPVLGVEFQAFTDTFTTQAVFSQRGTARALKMADKVVREILASDEFKTLRGGNFPRGKLDTTINSRPIAIVTQADLVLLVQIAAERGYAVARSMQEASFAVLLQQSVDEVLQVSRSRQTYLDAGASLRQKLEYRYSYHAMKSATFRKGYGVRALCRVNRQVSSLAVKDADVRRAASKSWRKTCSGVEIIKITVGNAVHQKAVEASAPTTLNKNLVEAAKRTTTIYELLEAPF